MGKLKVFCLPYAGGTKQAYSEWISEYSSLAEIIPVEYNGHGELFSEEFYRSLDEAANDICSRMISEGLSDYVIFGHSFGSLVALLTAEQLEKRGCKAPLAVMVSGTRPMHLKHKDRRLSGMGKAELMEQLFDFGQTSKEIMEEPELVDIIYDIMHNDVLIDENYVYKEEEHSKISVPLIVMTGSEDDEAPYEDMEEWQLYTTSRFYIKQFASGHFFPFECEDFKPYFSEMLKKISMRRI